MSDLPQEIIRLSELPSRLRRELRIEPDAAERAAIAEALGLLVLRKLRFEGALIPLGKRDWRLEARLGATVVQPCVVTLDPVTTRIEEEVRRTYAARFETPEADEIEMPEDDTTDPLPETLDLAEVMIEALALALPAYPRSEGATTGEAVFTEPGKSPLRDADLKPFAGLADLREALDQNGEQPDEEDPETGH